MLLKFFSTKIKKISLIIKFIKLIFFSFFSIMSIISIFLLFDMTDIDGKFLNRKLISININNLNSGKSIAVVRYLRDYYLFYYEYFFPEKFMERWSIENYSTRFNKEQQIVTKAKINNFSLPKYTTKDYINYLDWPRSHGNNFSTRFSGLEQINLSNIKNLKLAWKYSSNYKNISGKEYQANSIFYNNLIITPDIGNRIIALDASNGNLIWSFKVNSGIVAKRGLVVLKNNIGNSHSLFFTNNRDKLFALNPDTGKLIKSFGNNGVVKIGITPIPPVIYKNQLIIIDTDSVLSSIDINTGKINWKFQVNKIKNNLLFSNFGKGSPWGGLSLDEKRNLLFFTTGNPEPWYVGVDREGDNLFANSIVAFDLEKKKIAWHFQEIPHDVWNMDFAAPPVLTMIKKNNINIDVVVGISKLGNVVILDRETGEPLYDILRELSPISNIPGERTSIYQNNIKLPEPVCRNRFNPNLVFFKKNTSEEKKIEIKNILKNSTYGFPTPPHLEKNNIQIAACVRWAGASVDTKKNILYVSSDEKADNIIIEKDNKHKFSYLHRWETFVDDDGFPMISPPWGAITAVNLNNGRIIWQKPFGEYDILKKINLPKTGTFNRAGVTATSGDIIFASGTMDNKFIAINSITGEEIWEYKLNYPGSSPPTVYSVNGKEHVVISAFENGGNEIYSFVLN